MINKILDKDFHPIKRATIKKISLKGEVTIKLIEPLPRYLVNFWNNVTN